VLVFVDTIWVSRVAGALGLIAVRMPVCFKQARPPMI